MAILYQTVCGMLLSVTFVTFVTAAPDAKQAFEKYIKDPAGWGDSLMVNIIPNRLERYMLILWYFCNSKKTTSKVLTVTCPLCGIILYFAQTDFPKSHSRAVLFHSVA